MIDSADVFTESDAERHANEAYRAYLEQDFSMENPFDADRMMALEHERRKAVGPEREKARAQHIARAAFSNEKTGPWCDDEYHWHPHGKDTRTGRWFDTCTYCNPPMTNGKR